MGLTGYPKFLFKRFRATVITDIWLELVFFTSVASMVCLVSELHYNLGISPQMLTVLGIVLGLVVSFRTSSAYDRYWEGRKLWSTIALSSRQLAQIIWIHIPSERVESPTDQDIVHALLEKRTMVNLIQAFSVSMKHFLRGEPGIYYEDLYPLVCFLPRYIHSATPSQTQNGMSPIQGSQETLNNQLPLWYQSSPATKRKSKRTKRQDTFDPEKVLPNVEPKVSLAPARNPPQLTVWDFFPFLVPFRWIAKRISQSVRKRLAGEERTMSGRVRRPKHVESNVPLEISLFLSSYLASTLKKGLLQAALATAYANQLQSLQDCMTALSRVRNTPIPFAYQVHLRMSIWIYLFLLPFEVYGSFGWMTIPMTLFASFLILGFLEIGQEIENPFGYEANDLDLDAFCLEIERELHEITTHSACDPDSYIFTEANRPLAPSNQNNAEVLVKENEYTQPGGIAALRRTLLHNWQQVDEQTRDPWQVASEYGLGSTS